MQEVVGYQSFTLEGLVSEGRVWKNKECDFDELWQLLLHDDIDDPGGNSFIKKDALRLPSGISSQQAVQGAATNLWWESLDLDIKTGRRKHTSLKMTGVWPGTEKYSLPLLRLGP